MVSFVAELDEKFRGPIKADLNHDVMHCKAKNSVG
jgi:hypothetical protein